MVFTISSSHINAGDPDDITLHLQDKARIAEQRAKKADLVVDNISVPDTRYPIPEVVIRIASDRIKEGLRDIAPVVTKYRKERELREGSQVSSYYIDTRFPGAVYFGEKTHCEGGWKSG